jgi:3-oxoadipate enol-lactonase
VQLRLSSGFALGYSDGGSGRPVVFLHPVGTRRAFWAPVIDRLGSNYRSIAVDFRGHGDSDVPHDPFTLDDLADDVVALLRALKTTNVVVVGCSMGGMVAQGIALKAPELLSGMVLAGTNYMQTAESAKAMSRRAEDAQKGMAAVVDTTLSRWFPAAFHTAHPDVVEIVRGWLLEDDPVVFAWCWQAIAKLNYEAGLRKITIPALLIRGSEDASSSEERMRAMSSLLLGSRFVAMPEAGHLAPLEQPEVFADLLRGFISHDIAGAPSGT